MSEQSELPKLPWDSDEGPVFQEPCLSAEIGGARGLGDPDLGDSYYENWL